MQRAISMQGLRVAAANMAAALVYGSFVYAHLVHFIDTARASLLFIVAVETIVVVLLFIRKDASATWHSWQTWVTTVGGTFAPLLFRPTDAPSDLLVGQAVQLAGLALQIVAVFALNRSFGLLPAHREVKRGGLYRFVRHPLYAAYTMAHVGYLMNNLDAYNVAIFVVATGFQILRIRNEETFLLRFPEYASYAQGTRWRLIPQVW